MFRARQHPTNKSKRRKSNKLNFLWPTMARLGPCFGKNPPKKFVWVPSLRSFPGNEAHKLFSGGPKWGFGVGAKKLTLKTFMCFFHLSKRTHKQMFHWILRGTSASYAHMSSCFFKRRPPEPPPPIPGQSFKIACSSEKSRGEDSLIAERDVEFHVEFRWSYCYKGIPLKSIRTRPIIVLVTFRHEKCLSRHYGTIQLC